MKMKTNGQAERNLDLIWLAYNGEIYNFREIRQELKSFGYEFSSTSDTEVIIHAYHE